jgi:hypothetical protein
MRHILTGLAVIATVSCHAPRLDVPPRPQVCRSVATEQTPPAGWKGPLFRLNTEFPRTVPSEPRPWASIDFRTQPREYMLAARRYVYEGNIAADWNVFENTVRRWYHMPWRAYGNAGREFAHGLTVEFPSRPGTLSTKQASNADTYAIAIYNPVYAYTLGRVWPDVNAAPDLTGAGFQEGAVAAKLLFTDATGAELERLKGGFKWQANAFADSTCERAGCPREVRTLTLLQLDIAIKDARASQTGWVFMSFVYDRRLQGPSPWERMAPLGVMWGNDPLLSTPPGAQIAPTESVSFPLPQYEHYGCHGRLAGPLDNPLSSCLGCHMTAQYPPGAMVPSSAPCDSPANATFWRNLQGNQVFDPSPTPAPTALDYSQELASSIESYYACQAAAKSAAPPPERLVRRDR